MTHPQLYFYPRSPCGERLISIILCLLPTKFLSTLSLRRATCKNRFCPTCQWHFYPRSPCGERLRVLEVTRNAQIDFYPRSPCGERLTGAAALCSGWNFYPRSPCGERLEREFIIQASTSISIHALLAESDRKITITVDAGTLISIHALLAESDCLRRA